MKKSAKKYYKICKPLDKNVETGNVCINFNDIIKFDKDFEFDQEIDGVQYHKILPKEWVLNNMKVMHMTRINEETGTRKIIPFYVLKVDSILKF